MVWHTTEVAEFIGVALDQQTLAGRFNARVDDSAHSRAPCRIALRQCRHRQDRARRARLRNGDERGKRVDVGDDIQLDVLAREDTFEQQAQTVRDAGRDEFHAAELREGAGLRERADCPARLAEYVQLFFENRQRGHAQRVRIAKQNGQINAFVRE